MKRIMDKKIETRIDNEEREITIQDLIKLEKRIANLELRVLPKAKK